MTPVLARLLETTTIPPEIAQQIVTDATSDPEFWDGGREIWRSFHSSLIGVAWDWPWHAEWAEKFAKIGAFPRAWSPSADRYRYKIERELGHYDIRAWLLQHTAALLHYAQLKYVRPMPLKWCKISPVGDEPPAIGALIETRTQAYLMGQPGSMLPPYFPGDRTGWYPTIPSRLHGLGKRDCLYHGGLPFDLA